MSITYFFKFNFIFFMFIFVRSLYFIELINSKFYNFWQNTDHYEVLKPGIYNKAIKSALFYNQLQCKKTTENIILFQFNSI